MYNTAYCSYRSLCNVGYPGINGWTECRMSVSAFNLIMHAHGANNVLDVLNFSTSYIQSIPKQKNAHDCGVFITMVCAAQPIKHIQECNLHEFHFQTTVYIICVYTY